MEYFCACFVHKIVCAFMWVPVHNAGSYFCAYSFQSWRHTDYVFVQVTSHWGTLLLLPHLFTHSSEAGLIRTSVLHLSHGRDSLLCTRRESNVISDWNETCLWCLPKGQSLADSGHTVKRYRINQAHLLSTFFRGRLWYIPYCPQNIAERSDRQYLHMNVFVINVYYRKCDAKRVHVETVILLRTNVWFYFRSLSNY